VFNEHIYHPYGLFDREAEQANTAKGLVQGSPLSLYIPIYPQKG
jgi:hypothetical protein